LTFTFINLNFTIFSNVARSTSASIAVDSINTLCTV
jgi:hypothetical protein